MIYPTTSEQQNKTLGDGRPFVAFGADIAFLAPCRMSKFEFVKLVGASFLIAIVTCACGSGTLMGNADTGSGGSGGDHVAATGGGSNCGFAMATCGSEGIFIGGEPCPIGRDCYMSYAGCTETRCARPISANDSGVEGSDAAVCNPASENNRLYFVRSSCESSQIACPTYTSYFANVCGCGCEQDSVCPPYVDCASASGIRDPLCSDMGPCPYSVRVT